jgi:shikimate kinase
VGLPGSGKSTVAPLLADLLGVRSFDTDALTVEAMGCSIDEAFDLKGEAWFRSHEHEVVTSLILRERSGVIAVAGGAVGNESTRTALAAYCDTVWLLTPVAVLAARLAGTTEVRPLLRNDTRATLERLQAQRGAWYDQVSHHHVWADDEPEGVALTIGEAIALGGPSCCGSTGERWHPCSITRRPYR